MNQILQPFLLGVAAIACLAIGAFFWLFWRRTRDRLLLAFAVAFFLFAANWTLLAVLHYEGYPAVYILRLLGFGCIIAGTVDKNRNSNPARGPSGRSSKEAYKIR